MSGFEEETYSTMFMSLKHPIRRRILRMLSEKLMSFSEMLEELGVSSSHLTYHLENLGELVSKMEDGRYKLSTFGEAAVTTMSKVEETQKTGEQKHPLSLKWKSLLAALLIGLVILAGVCYTQYQTLRQLRLMERVELWTSVWGFETTEELFCPGPLGYHISVGDTKPGELIGVQFYVWKEGRPALPWLVEFKLIQVDEGGNPLRVVDQKICEIKKGEPTGACWGWETKVPYLAPAYYKFGVVIRDEEGVLLGKLVSTLRVPKQELNAKLFLNKREFQSGENLELTIHNQGPTTISFGLYYTVEYLGEDGEWRPATWLQPSFWYDIMICLRPGKSYTQSIELSQTPAGTYRISKEVEAQGTYITKTLTETFTVTEATDETHD